MAGVENGLSQIEVAGCKQPVLSRSIECLAEGRPSQLRLERP
ncbi:hypothetical protein [Mesorhizobium sp. NZP2077]|nr:hypothetical protein [Mesorhizobium sp. NZP2077]